MTEATQPGDGRQPLPGRSEAVQSLVIDAAVVAIAHRAQTDVHHILLALLSNDPYTQSVFSARHKEDTNEVIKNLKACIQGQRVETNSQHKPGELTEGASNVLRQARETAAHEQSPMVYPRHVLRAIFMQQPTNYYAHAAVSRQMDISTLMQNFARCERRKN